MKKLLFCAAVLGSFGALAKIPAPVLDDAAKAKAAEAAAKTAWQAKIDAFLLCKSQDKAVAAYKKNPNAKPPMPLTPVAMPASAPAMPAAAASKPAGTPVAAAGPSACSDPGPFAYAPPDQKPLETSGAHSPAPTATSPPSVKPNSAEMAPSKPGVATPGKKS